MRPAVWYNKEGDLIEATWEDGAWYAEYLSPGLSLCRSQETKAIVGVIIGGIGPLMRKEDKA